MGPANQPRGAALTERNGSKAVERSRPRILLSEGSSLSARQAITAFGLAGHRVDIVTSDTWCLGRFSRFVRHVHPAPLSGRDPDGYLDAVLEIVAQHRIGALIPVHEQAYLFAAIRHRLPATLGVALAEFEAFEQVQARQHSAHCSRASMCRSLRPSWF